jgi:putative transposase
VLHAERFWDAAPATVYATLLDEASYLNFEHRHSGIALLTPADVHYGHAEQITLARGAVLAAADAARPERFVGKPPHLPEAVWINKPIDPSEAPQQFPG